MAARLRKLRVSRVALVEAGANFDPASGEGAHITLVKRAPAGAGSGTMDKDTIEASVEQVGELADALVATAEDFADVEKVGRKISGDRLKRLKQLVAIANGIIGETDVDDDDEKEKRGKKKEKSAAAPAPAGVRAFLKNFGRMLKMSDTDIDVALKDVEPEGDAKDDVTDVTNDVTDVTKDVPEPVRAHIATLRKRLTDAEAAQKKTQEAFEHAQREARRIGFVAKAKAFKQLAIDPEKDADVLMTIADAAPKAFERVEAILRGADAAVRRSGIYSEVGTAGHAGNVVPEGESATARALAKAAEIVSKDASGKTSQAEALTRVFDENPGLYDEYVEESCARRGRRRSDEA